MNIALVVTALFVIGALVIVLARFLPRGEAIERGESATTPPPSEQPSPSPHIVESVWGEREEAEFSQLPEAARCDLLFSIEERDDDRGAALLAHALTDRSEVVATAAAHALITRGQRDTVERYLATCDDERKRSMARTLRALFPDLAVEEPHEQPLETLSTPVRVDGGTLRPRGAQATLVLDLAHLRLQEELRAIERADSGGMLRHLSAVRRLLPERSVGATSALDSALRAARDAMNAPISRLVMTLNRPRPVVSSKDIEDGAGRLALRSLLDVLLATPGDAEMPVATGDMRLLAGVVDLDEIARARARLENEPIGAALPWVINVQLLPTVLLVHGEERDILSQYRARAAENLAVLCELPVAEFHRVIATHSDRVLDTLLDDALAELGKLDVEA